VRIALVCPYDWDRWGGVQGHVGALAGELATRHEVCIVAPRSRKPSDDDGAGPASADRPVAVASAGWPVPVPYNRARAPVALSPLAARRTLAALRRFRPDVVHVHEPAAPILSTTAAALGPRPVVGTFHAWSSSERVYRLAGTVVRPLTARLAACIAVSPAAAAYASTALGVPTERFEVIGNGIATWRYASVEPPPELVSPRRPTMLFVGRLEARKGLDVAVRAFLRLRQTWPQLRLVVVGDGPERARCEAMVPASARGDVWFAGAVAEADKPGFFAGADLLCAPNLEGESFGIVLLEAMAAGLPVVASDLPGFRTLVSDRRQGRLVPAGDADALAAAAGELLGDEAQRTDMGAAARQVAAAYDWSVIARTIESVYARAHAGAG
jgi:phosphatidylinositol alpha-mannosyltransferase